MVSCIFKKSSFRRFDETRLGQLGGSIRARWGSTPLSHNNARVAAGLLCYKIFVATVIFFLVTWSMAKKVRSAYIPGHEHAFAPPLYPVIMPDTR